MLRDDDLGNLLGQGLESESAATFQVPQDGDGEASLGQHPQRAREARLHATVPDRAVRSRS